MSTTMDHDSWLPPTDRVGTLTRAVDDAVTALDQLTPSLLSVEDRRTALVQWSRLVSRLTARQLALIADSEVVAQADGHRDLTAWLVAHTGRDRSDCRRDVELARALDRRWFRVGESLAAGALSVAQARTIVTALEELPDDIPLEVVTSAEEHLISLADDFGPAQLRNLGRAVLEAVAPHVAEEHERRQLEAEESRADDTMRLTTRRLGTGSTRITLTIPDHIADRFGTYLHAHTNPRRLNTGDERVCDDGSVSRIRVVWLMRSVRYSRHSRAQGFRCTAATPPPWWSR